MTTMLKRAAALVAGTAMVVGMAAPVFAEEAGDVITVNLDILATISIDCTDTITMGAITGTGQSALTTNDALCTVISSEIDGYTVDWQASSATMANADSDTIAAYNEVASAEVWDTGATVSEWGANIHDFTPGDAGVATPSLDLLVNASGAPAYASDGWLNVAASYTDIFATDDDTSADGDTFGIMFGAEVGATKWQPTGTYTVDVTVRATTN
jgi:hypothetical protein